MLAINRKYIGTNVYLNSQQISSNGNTHVLGVGLHDNNNNNNNNKIMFLALGIFTTEGSIKKE